MTFHLLHQTGSNNHAQSPFRIIEQQTGREVAWINRFLDRECVRRLADTTLRSYALDLMYFVRWWASVHQTDAITEDAIAGSTLLDYVRFQSGQKPRPAAASINRRVFVIERALQNEFPHVPGQFAPGFQKVYWKRSQLAVERPRPALSRADPGGCPAGAARGRHCRPPAGRSSRLRRIHRWRGREAPRGHLPERRHAHPADAHARLRHGLAAR